MIIFRSKNRKFFHCVTEDPPAIWRIFQEFFTNFSFHLWLDVAEQRHACMSTIFESWRQKLGQLQSFDIVLTEFFWIFEYVRSTYIQTLEWLDNLTEFYRIFDRIFSRQQNETEPANFPKFKQNVCEAKWTFRNLNYWTLDTFLHLLFCNWIELNLD